MGQARKISGGHALRSVVVVGAALGLTAASCQTVETYSGPMFSRVDEPISAAFLTYTGQDTYGFAVTTNDEDGDITVMAQAADSNRQDDTRAVFWRLDGFSTLDQESCTTWDNATDALNQPGVALRIRYSSNRARAITITKNVWYYASWIFNVHVMDSGASPRYVQIGSADLSSVFRANGQVPDYPWRMCARVVGDVVSFKVWPLTHAEPAWDDPAYGASVTLPASWSGSHAVSGRPGWYVGHLRAGQSVEFSRLGMATVGRTPKASRHYPNPDATTTTVGSTPTVTADTVPVEPTTPPQEPTSIAQAP